MDSTFAKNLFFPVGTGKKFLMLRGRDVEMSIITHERAAFMGCENSAEGQIFGKRQFSRLWS